MKILTRLSLSHTRNLALHTKRNKKKKSRDLFIYYGFWAKAWFLVAEVYTWVSELDKEVKKTDESGWQNCDRLKCGLSASSSSVFGQSKTYGRKSTKKSNLKSSQHSITRVDAHVPCNVKDTSSSEGICSQCRNAPILSKSLALDSLNSKIISIFKFLEDSLAGDLEDVLTSAISFFDEARKVVFRLRRFPDASMALHHFAYWKAQACNKLGKSKLNNGDNNGAELAFLDAKEACKEVDNLVGVAMNTFWLGRCKSLVIDKLASSLEHFRKYGWSDKNCMEILGAAKSDYIEYLRYLTAARSEIDAVKLPNPEANKVKDIILNDLGNTYINLATLLVMSSTDLEVSESQDMEKLFINAYPSSERGVKRRARKHKKISAEVVILEGVKIFESMGEWAKYQVAEAYRQLAYLIKENMEKSMHLLNPQEYPSAYLKILMDQVDFSSSLTSSLLSNSNHFSSCYLRAVK